MTVKPIKTLKFNEQVSFSIFSDRHEQFIITGQERRHYILDKNFEIKCTFKVSFEISPFSAIHPHESLVSIMGKDNLLHVVDYSGTDIWVKKGEYIATCWSLDGINLYTLLRIDSSTLILIVYDNAGTEIAEKVFEDELYESDALLSTIPNHSEIVIQLMAGQDGCTIIFVNLDKDKKLFMRIMSEYDSHTCTAFNENGTRFLCIENNESEICHFTYPELKKIAMRRFNEDERSLDYTLIYLYNRAIIRYREQFYLMDLKNMEKMEKLIIEGHEPVPANQIYPNLVNDDEEICDIAYLCVAGEYLLGTTNKNSDNEVIVLEKII